MVLDNINGTAGYMGSMNVSQQCSVCSVWHYGYHVCQSVAFPGTVGWITAPPVLTVADVERIVAKALEDHAKPYLAVIDKLVEALAGKK